MYKCHRSQKRVLDALEKELHVVVSCPLWVLGTNLGPLEEQQVLLTAEPSLQIQETGFISEALYLTEKKSERQRCM